MNSSRSKTDDVAADARRIVRASPIPIYIQIEEEIRGSIESGKLGPLDQVASETELAALMGVSRMTARKALDRLVADGLLFRQPGKGTFVAPLKMAHAASQGLSFSAAMRAQGLQCSTDVLEAGLVRAPLKIAKELNLLSGAPVVVMRRLRRIDEMPVAIHLAYLPGRLSALLDADLTSSLSDLMGAVGARVERSEDTLEAVLATGEEAALLRVPNGAPLILIRGTAFTSANERVRYSEGLYPGAKWRLGMDIGRDADLRPELKTFES